MGHLSTFERMKVIEIFNELQQPGIKKFEKVSQLAKKKGIEISSRRVRDIVEKWLKTSKSVFLEANWCFF